MPPGYNPDFKQVNAEMVERALQPLQASFAALPDKPLGIYLGLALDGASPAFDGDIRRARDLLFLPAASGPTVLLSNLQAKPVTDPHAEFISMPKAARAAGAWLKAHALQSGASPMALVVIAAHGDKNLLGVRAGRDQFLALINGGYVNAFLNDLGTAPTIVIITACHSGSLIPALRRPNRIILVAAAADRVSFGCGAGSTSTVFMQALLDPKLNQALSLSDLFAQARNRIISWEMRSKTPHSLPEIDVGADMQVFAASPISHWSKALREFRVATPP